jgi:peptide/nickel transport system permease protein
MAGYLFARLMGALVTLFCVTALAFVATALAPGSPASILLGNMATPERVAAVTKQLGLDKPLPIRYLLWLEQTLRGNLGTSNLSFRPVKELIGAALPVTLELALLSLALSILVAFPAGLVLAQQRHRRWTNSAMAVITIGVSVPGFWVGLILIIVFAVNLRLLPSGGYVPFTSDPVANLRHIALPTVSLAIYLAPALTRFVRIAAQAVLREEYIDTARSKGIGVARVLLRHVAPNTLVVTLTYLGLQLGVLISGATVIEVIFALPGIGRLGMSAVLNRDYPVIQGVVLVAATAYVVVNFVVDIAYSLIDPRIRTR